MLHLTPIHGIVQLRPSFEYLDKADDNSKKNSAAETGKLTEFFFNLPHSICKRISQALVRHTCSYRIRLPSAMDTGLIMCNRKIDTSSSMLEIGTIEICSGRSRTVLIF